MMHGQQNLKCRKKSHSREANCCAAGHGIVIIKYVPLFPILSFMEESLKVVSPWKRLQARRVNSGERSSITDILLSRKCIYTI